MAVNLGKRNINSGVQGNQKTQPIPTGPSTTVGVANDPGVAGGPRNIPQGAFGTEGGGAFAKGLQDVSLSVLDATLDRQTAFVKAQELEKEGEEKNVMAEGKIGARADYEQLRLTADLDTSKGKKEFFKKFGEVIDKWQPLMNGARRQDEYESDLRVIQTEQSIEASKEIYGAGVRINKARAGKAGDDVINENRNVDPRNIWGEIFNSVSEAAGSDYGYRRRENAGGYRKPYHQYIQQGTTPRHRAARDNGVNKRPFHPAFRRGGVCRKDGRSYY